MVRAVGKNRLGSVSFPAVASESARTGAAGESESGISDTLASPANNDAGRAPCDARPGGKTKSSGGGSGGRRTPAEAAPFAQGDRPDGKRQGAAEATRIDLGDGDLGDGAVLDRRGDGTALDRP